MFQRTSLQHGNACNTAVPHVNELNDEVDMQRNALVTQPPNPPMLALTFSWKTRSRNALRGGRVCGNA